LIKNVFFSFFSFYLIKIIKDNIKTLTAEKAMEVFEEKLNEKNITFYPKEKWTLILKKDSRTGIFIHINQNSYMISGYWHPLRRHEGIIGQKINGIKTDVKNEISDAGYWAIAINEADNEFGYSYCKTYKENTNDKEIYSIKSSQNSIKKKRSFGIFFFFFFFFLINEIQIIF